MPNWCTNVLLVEGPTGQLKKFDEDFKGYPPAWGAVEKEEKGYALNALYPVPAEVLAVGYRKPSKNFDEEMLAISDPDKWRDGYSWCISHWGTKGELIMQEVNLKEASYMFQTAWSPAVPWLTKVAVDHPQLSFTLKYYELGNAFAGKSIFEKGFNCLNMYCSAMEHGFDVFDKHLDKEFGLKIAL